MPKAAGGTGFTLLELLIALVLLGLAYTIALPSIGRTRISAAVHNSTQVVVSTVSLARATAIRYGRPAVLRLDAAGERIWVEVDTTVAGGAGAVDTLGLFHFSDAMAVDLQSDRSSLCFDGRGIGAIGASCPEAGATVVLALKDRADTVVVSPLGRVLP